MQAETLANPDGGDPLYADHHRDGRFFNPWSPFPHSLLTLLRFWVRTIPRAPTRVLEPRGAFPAGRPRGSAVITWIGHCSFAIQHDGGFLLTDPHWGPRARIRRRKVPPGVILDAVPRGAYAVISHNHYDHLDRHTVSRLPSDTRWFVPLGLARWFRKLGHEHVVELDWWQRVRCDGWTLTCLPAQHWSIRLAHRKNETLWCSWLIETPAHRFYFAGDTGYFHGFTEFGRRFGPIDAAFLPIGTYEPRRQLAYQHMEPGEAYRAAIDLGARRMIPMHWGTFQLGQDRMNEAPQVLFARIAETGGDADRVRLLDIGESWQLT